MTLTEKKQSNFAVNDEVYILDGELCLWVQGVVTGGCDEGIEIKWEDVADPVLYDIDKLPDIRHRRPNEQEDKRSVATEAK